MDESLKAVNLIHQLIIGVSAAIIAFGLSPDKAKQYQVSLSELTAMRQLSMDDYVSFVKKSIPTQGRESYAAALKQAGFPTMSDSFSVQHELYVERPKGDAPLGEFFRFFRGNSKVMYAEYVAASLRPRKVKYVLSENCRPTGINLSPDNSAARDSYVLLGTVPLAGTKQVFVSFARYGGDMNCGLSVPAQIDAFVQMVPGNQVGDWLRSNKISPDSFLATSKQLAGVIGTKSPLDASKFLEDTVNAPKRELSFLGITVPEEIAVWIGPLVTVLLLLFFLSHLRHIVTDAVFGDPLLRTFPWIGLFRDNLSKILTYGSIMLLPAIANGRLVLRSWPASEGASGPGLLGAALTLGVTAAGIVAVFEIHRLRSMPRAERVDPLDVLREASGNPETKPEG